MARGCERLTIVQGGGRFADFVTRVPFSMRNGRRSRWKSSHSVPLDPAKLTGGALLVVGRFDEDVVVIRSSKSRLVGCVALIPAFAEAAGSAAKRRAAGAAAWECGPVQWLATSEQPAVGPRVRCSSRAIGSVTRAHPAMWPPKPLPPDTWRPRLNATVAPGDLSDWSISTMLGEFRVDASGRQIGHRVSVVQWREGRMEPVG